MRKALAGLVVGLLIGCFTTGSVIAGKKKDQVKNGRITDSNNDGVVEFAIPLYRAKVWYHECCDCSLIHKVTTQVIEGPIGLPWLHMRWERDANRTHQGRTLKFGPNYRGGGLNRIEEQSPW